MSTTDHPDSIEQMAKALATLGDRHETTVRLLSAISDLSAIPVRCSGLTEAANEILNTVVRLLEDIKACSLLLYDHRSDALRLLAAKGPADLLGDSEGPYNKDLTFRPGQGVAGQVFVDQWPVFHDASTSVALNLSPAGSTPKVLACLPLLLSDLCLGVMNISFHGERRMDPRARRDLSLLSGVVASVIRTMILKSEVGEKAASLEKKIQEVHAEVARRRLMEAEAQKARDYFRSVVDSMPSILVGVDRSGVVTWWNRTAEEITGLDGPAILGRPIAEVLPDFPPLAHLVSQGLAEGRTFRMEKFVTSRRGEKTYWDLTVFPIGVETPTGAVVRMDPVTDRVRLEEIMIQTEKMVGVGTLAAGMAHEINNPLAGVLQGAQMIRRRLEANHPRNAGHAAGCDLTPKEMAKWDQYLQVAGVLRFLAGIEDSGQRAARIVKDLLEFTRCRPTDSAPRDLSSLIDKALSLSLTDYDLKRQYDVKRMTLIREYDPDLPPVPCDSGQLQQVIINLVRNAAEALTEKVDQPDFEPVIAVRTRLERPWAVIEVTDNGPGVPEVLREKIFEPFYTSKPVGQGTGLGLYVSYGLIRKHGGTMICRTDEQGQTSFEIRLPLT